MYNNIYQRQAASVHLAREKETRHLPPSWLAEATALSIPGTLSRYVTESACPSNAATNGRANIRSNLLAFSARLRSRARACGCWSGSRFREIGAGAPEVVGRCETGSCVRREIFCACKRALKVISHDYCHIYHFCWFLVVLCVMIIAWGPLQRLQVVETRSVSERGLEDCFE